jgi:hypothetical protein
MLIPLEFLGASFPLIVNNFVRAFPPGKALLSISVNNLSEDIANNIVNGYRCV